MGVRGRCMTLRLYQGTREAGRQRLAAKPEPNRKTSLARRDAKTLRSAQRRPWGMKRAEERRVRAALGWTRQSLIPQHSDEELAPLVRHDPQIAQVERFAISREAQVGLPGAFHESTFGLHGPGGKADAGALFVARVEAEAEQGDRRRRRGVVIGQSQLLERETGRP